MCRDVIALNDVTLGDSSWSWVSTSMRPVCPVHPDAQGANHVFCWWIWLWARVRKSEEKKSQKLSVAAKRGLFTTETVTVVSGIWLSARYGCQRDMAVSVIWLLARVHILVRNCALPPRPGCCYTKTVTAVSEIWQYIWLQFGCHYVMCVMCVLCVLKTIMDLCEL